MPKSDKIIVWVRKGVTCEMTQEEYDQYMKGCTESEDLDVETLQVMEGFNK